MFTMKIYFKTNVTNNIIVNYLRRTLLVMYMTVAGETHSLAWIPPSNQIDFLLGLEPVEI